MITYLLTPWSRALLEKLNVFQPIKKFPAFHGTRMFITAVTSACHLSLSLSWAYSMMFRNKTRFYGEELLAPRLSSRLEDHPLSAVRNCLFKIFAATLHIGGRSSIRNPKTSHAAVPGNLWWWLWRINSTERIETRRSFKIHLDPQHRG
jgi:hypothetical protein